MSMKRWSVYGKVYGTKYLGVYEAETAEEAEQLAVRKAGAVCLCHDCAKQVSDPEIDGCVVDQVED